MNEHEDRFLRMGDVTRKTGRSRAAIYRMIAEGTFPPQIQIGTRAVGWRLSSVLEWMESPRDYQVKFTGHREQNASGISKL